MTCSCGSGYDRDVDICAAPRAPDGPVDMTCPNCGIDPGLAGTCPTCADYGAHDGPCSHRVNGPAPVRKGI